MASLLGDISIPNAFDVKIEFDPKTSTMLAFVIAAGVFLAIIASTYVQKRM